MRRRATRRSALLIVIAMIGGLLAATMGTAAAATVVTVTPNSNLVVGQTITVSTTPDTSYPAGIFGAATQCGNANSAGVGYTSQAQITANECGGQADGFGVGLNLFSDAGAGFPGALGGGITSGVTYNTTIQALKTGIGVSNAQCLPVDGVNVVLPCTVSVAFADAGGVSYGTPVSIPVTYRPPATVAIDTVTGQNGNAAARSGNTLNISGINWDNNASVTAQLCTTDLVTCDAAISGATVGGTGALSGALVVPVGATTGARALKVTDGVQTATAAVQILGTRSISLSPAAGGIGTSVAVNGANYDAVQPVAIQALDSAFAPVGAPVISASSATGAVNGNFPIADAATAYIAVAETDAPTTDNALAPFAFSANSCNGTGCTVLQTVTLVVNPGVINITQAANSVTMSPITLNGDQQASSGSLSDVTITDARGSLVGWSVTATMTDLNLAGGGTNSTIAKALMTISPTCGVATATSGSATGITAGTATQSFSGTATLCTAAVGEGGGTYAVDGGLDLTIPANVRSGTYTSTITVLLT